MESMSAVQSLATRRAAEHYTYHWSRVSLVQSCGGCGGFDRCDMYGEHWEAMHNGDQWFTHLTSTNSIIPMMPPISEMRMRGR